MWCCCGQKRAAKSILLDDQVEALVEKCALVADNLQYVEEENIRFRNMLWQLDDCYYELDFEIKQLNSEFQMALPQRSSRPGGRHEQRGRWPRRSWSELRGSTNGINNTTDY